MFRLFLQSEDGSVEFGEHIDSSTFDQVRASSPAPADSWGKTLFNMMFCTGPSIDAVHHPDSRNGR